MPPILSRTPTAAQFADAWTAALRRAVNDATPRGKLTQKTAEKISARADDLRWWADNVENFLQSTGKSSASRRTLFKAAHEYAQSQAAQAAGPDGRVSLADAKALRTDLQNDFRVLRGKRPQATSPQLSREEIARLIDSSFDLWQGPSSVQARALELEDLPAKAREAIEHVELDASAANHDVRGYYAFYPPGESTPVAYAIWTTSNEAAYYRESALFAFSAAGKLVYEGGDTE